MIDEESVIQLRDRIATEFKPRRIVMFGSYAYGNPANDSDLDILVVLPHQGSGLRMAAEILNRVQPRIPVDLIVRTPEEVHQRLQENDFFLAEVCRRGRVLYEAPDR